MSRHRGLIAVTLLLILAGFISWYFTQQWEGWEYILLIVGKGDTITTGCSSGNKGFHATAVSGSATKW